MKYEQVRVMTKSYIRLNIDDVDMGDYGKEQYEHLLDFPIHAYTKLKLNDQDSTIWDERMGIVNLFLDTLKPEIKSKLSMSLITLRGLINMESNKIINDTSKIPALNRELSDIVLDLEQECNLKELLVDFVEDNVFIDHTSDNGRRAQDTKGMTFERYLVVEAISLAIYCKIMVPVFGTYIELLKPRTSKSAKERHSVSILNDMLDLKYPELLKKLQTYLTTHVKNGFTENTNTIMQGSTTATHVSSIMDTTICRNLVNAILTTEQSGVLNYLMVSAKRSMGTHSTTSAIQYRETSSKFSNDDGDDGNMSQLEASTLRSSKQPMSIGFIVRNYTHKFVSLEIEREGLSQDEFDKLYQYYLTNPPQITKLLIQLISSVYGNHLGGATSVKYLGLEDMCKIVTLMQILAIKKKRYALSTFLTMSKSLMTSNNVRTDDAVHIVGRFMSDEAYVKCRDFYASTITNGEIIWDEKIQEAIGELGEYQYCYNMHTSMYNGKNLNGNVFMITCDVLVEVCQVIQDHLYQV